MVRAYHAIFCTYGFWLPNDPRGSWSDFVGAWELLKYGKATKTRARRSLAGREHDVDRRLAAKKKLKYPAVELTGAQARAVARGFDEYVQSADLVLRACSILPDHVHLVVLRHRCTIEQIVNHLKGAATRSIVAEGIHPLSPVAAPGKRPPKMWARGQWSVYLDDETDVVRAIRYVEDNPAKEGKRRQRWSFVAAHPAGSAPLRCASGRG
jgi:REP element-mobilizing transposase RayT